MNKEYKAVLFDLDGTLLNTYEGIILTVKDTIEHFGLNKLSEEEIRTFIGPPIEWSFEDKLGVTGDKLKEVCSFWRETYVNKNLLLAEEYDGMKEFIAYLKGNGVRLGVATYKKDDYARKLLEHYGFTSIMDVIHGSDYENKLSKADIIEWCIKDLDVPKDSVLMVGDTKHDAIGALNAKVDFAGVTFGFGFGEYGEDISSYEHIICVDKVLELKSLWEDKND